MAYKPNVDIENSRIRVFNIGLLEDVEKTFVTSSITAADATLTVQNIAGGAVNGYLLVGELGQEKTELLQIHASTAPSGTTITLAATAYPTFNHPTDTPIYFINYNQVEFSRATTSGGDKSILVTSAITPDQECTVYNDVTNSTGYAYTRFKNSTTTTYSDYSDEQSYGTIEGYKAGALINRVLNIAHTSAPREVLLDFINDAILKIKESKVKWRAEEASRDASNSYGLASETFTLPTLIKELKGEYVVWIGPEGGKALTYIDIATFEDKLENLPRTTLNGAVLSGATSVVLTDSSNFPDAGTAYIGTDEFTWTARDLVTHTLSGVDGILAHDSGELVLGSDYLGTPEFWTIWNGTGRLFAAPDSTNSGKRLIIEYYQGLADVDSENDSIPYAFWGLIVDYVLMRLAQRNREFTEADRYQIAFDKSLAGRIARERLNEIRQLQV